MNDIFEISKTSVEDVLKSTPRTVRLFLDWHTGCVGCGFARFCTLKDVIDTYHIDESLFVQALAKIAARKSYQGEQNEIVS
jgi:hypothetical protein